MAHVDADNLNECHGRSRAKPTILYLFASRIDAVLSEMLRITIRTLHFRLSEAILKLLCYKTDYRITHAQYPAARQGDLSAHALGVADQISLKYTKLHSAADW